MKKLIVLVFAFLAISCSKDEIPDSVHSTEQTADIEEIPGLVNSNGTFLTEAGQEVETEDEITAITQAPAADTANITIAIDPSDG